MKQRRKQIVVQSCEQWHHELHMLYYLFPNALFFEMQLDASLIFSIQLCINSLWDDLYENFFVQISIHTINVFKCKIFNLWGKYILKFHSLNGFSGGNNVKIIGTKCVDRDYSLVLGKNYRQFLTIWASLNLQNTKLFYLKNDPQWNDSFDSLTNERTYTECTKMITHERIIR